MQRYGFKMHLDAGRRDEYRKRHDEIWPELVEVLHQAGVTNYSIFLDEETNVLFGYLERPDDHGMEDLPRHPVMKLWWQHMKDVMRTNADGSPVAVALTPVFYMA